MTRSAIPLIAAVFVLVVGVGAAASPTFEPASGRYTGSYTSGNHGSGEVRLKVGPRLIRSRFSGVRLVEWNGKLRCPGHRTQRVDMQMTAWRTGRTFSGFVVQRTSPYERQSFTGRFTAKEVLQGAVRVTRGRGAARCDTGRVTFVAHRVVP